MSPVSIVLALVITAAAAVLQGSVGLGFAMLSVPLLSLIDPQLAPTPQLIVALPLTVSVALREGHSIELRGFWWIIAGRIPGAFIGVALLAVATQRMLDVFIALVVLAAVALILRGFHVTRTPTAKFLAGTASGTTGVVASIGGPPIALLYSRAEARTIRSTLAAVFTIGVALSLTFRAASGHVSMTDLRVAAMLFPAVVVGYLISTAVKDRIPTSRARTAILVVSAIAAGALLVRAVLT